MKRPALRYHGGKFRLAQWIISHFPPHDHFVDVFGGGASVLLAKTPSMIDTYNDIDRAVVTFFRVLRDRPGELIRALEFTPWSREELRMSRKPANDELETARRVFVAAWQGRGKVTAQWSTGWRYEIRAIRGTRAYKDSIDAVDGLRDVAERLRQIQIECDDWRNVIDRFDTRETLFYLDPPYLPDTRSQRWRTKAYRHEMSEAEHREMANRIHRIKGMAIVSGYPSMLYDEIFAGWHTVTRMAQTDGRPTKRKPRRIECLWISPSTMNRMTQRGLFS